MARKYDIAQRIADANQKPTIAIDNEHEFVINNGKSVVIMVVALAEEMESKPESESIEAMDKIISLVFKESEVEYINSLDLTLPAYQLIIEAIMAAFGNQDLDEVETKAKKGKK